MDITTQTIKAIKDSFRNEHSVIVKHDESYGPLEISSPDYKAKFTSFFGATFNHIVSFGGIDLSIGLLFDNCKFKGPLNFKNIKASGIDLTLNPNSGSIVFKNCVFEDKIIFDGDGTLIERSLVFENCTILQDLEILNITISQGGLYFKNCSIKKKIDVFGSKIALVVQFENNNVSYVSRFDNVVSSSLVFSQNNVFESSINIYNSKFDNGIIFNNGTFKEEVFFEAIETKGTGLAIIGSSFEKAFFVNIHSKNKQLEQGISNFYLSDTTFKNGIYVNGTQDLLAELPIVEFITLDISAKLSGDIVFRDLQVGILSLGGYNTSSNISFERIYTNQVKIKGLINSAGLIFSALRPSYINWFRDKDKKVLRENAIYIDDTNFGKAQFFQTDFNAFDIIVFHNNICADISTSLVKWFTPAQLDRDEIKHSIKSLKQAKKTKDSQKIDNARKSLLSTYNSKKEIYRQLKLAHQKQADIPQALEFQRYEMNYYRKMVCLKRPQNFSEIITLWCSQSNDFGQSWIKPVWLFIIFSFVFFLPVGFLNSTTLDYSQFASSWSDVSYNLKVIFCDNIFKWIVLLNPVHSMKDINENIQNVPGIIYLFDFLSRIISSYFIFQIVSAFRKYFK